MCASGRLASKEPAWAAGLGRAVGNWYGWFFIFWFDYPRRQTCPPTDSLVATTFTCREAHPPHPPPLFHDCGYDFKNRESFLQLSCALDVAVRNHGDSRRSFPHNNSHCPNKNIFFERIPRTKDVAPGAAPVSRSLVQNHQTCEDRLRFSLITGKFTQGRLWFHARSGAPNSRAPTHAVDTSTKSNFAEKPCQ